MQVGRPFLFVLRFFLYFQCKWCPSAKRCSNGLDRHRQDWLMKECDKKNVASESQCSQISSSNSYVHDVTYNTDEEKHPENNPYQASSRVSNNGKTADGNVKMGVSGIIVTIFIIAMVSGLAVWVFYAYRNPHTTSGQILIRVSYIFISKQKREVVLYCQKCICTY